MAETKIDGRAFAEKQIAVALAGRIAERLARRSRDTGWVRHRTPEEIKSFHESGHVVIADAEGWFICEASIVAEEDVKVGGGFSGGHVTVTTVRPTEPAKEKRARPTESETDIRTAAKFCWLLSGCGWRETLRGIRQRRAYTTELLILLWPKVEKLAQELVKNRELDQAAIERILRAQQVAA